MLEKILKLAFKLSNKKAINTLLKIATPELFDADKPEKYGDQKFIELYRMQNKSGQGYESIDWLSIDDYNLFQNIENAKPQEARLPPPLSDSGFEPHEQWPTFYQGKLFAFESPEQIDKYYTLKQLELLNRNGFSTQKVKAKKAWHSLSQAYYVPY